MNTLNEDLLAAWLRLSTSVINSRVVSELSYNESLVCNALYTALKNNPENPLTATDLCNTTRMLKSQMNRTLNQLEKREMIIRQRSESDKRKIFILLNQDKLSDYEKQHTNILQLIDGIISHLGEDKTYETMALFHEISNIADNLLKEK